MTGGIKTAAIGEMRMGRAIPKFSGFRKRGRAICVFSTAK